MLEIILTTLIFLALGCVIGAVYSFVHKPETNAEPDEDIKNQQTAAAENKPMQAVILCSGTIDENLQTYSYSGVKDCRAALSLGNGGRICSDGCIGLGSCVKACPENAISVRKGLAAVDVNSCIGCGECLSACPRGLIVLKERDYRTAKHCARNCPGGVCGACAEAETGEIN